MIPSHSRSSTAQGQAESSARSKPNITDFTIYTPDSKARPTAAEPGPSRWRTKEFMLYWVILLLVVPVMVYWPMRLSSLEPRRGQAVGQMGKDEIYAGSLHPNWSEYSHRLTPGWLFGRPVDNSDAQYRSFRDGLPGLVILASIYLVVSSAHSHLSPSAKSRSTFLLISSLPVLVILHGFSAWKVVAIIYLNYNAVKSGIPPKASKLWPGLLIGGNMVILLLNERYEGYDLGILDLPLRGVLPVWHVHFKITMLRIVSFGLDYHWRDTHSSADPPTDHRGRTSRSLPDDQYSLANCIAYCLYPPLYIAGPIVTFNDFMWQVQAPLKITVREKSNYAFRYICSFLTMEAVLHTMYVVAIKDTQAWEGDSPADLSMIGFWNLVVVWLKLLLPWRFFRLWALLDGVDPPENMIRCVANNYSTLGFWRSWHRSYNLWVVRYIYIPVGGSRNAAAATLLVFTFVALWHDLSFKLLVWGWLVSLFILPELLARKVLPFDKYGHEPWYRHVAAIGGVINILFMMSANLVGFVLGIEGMKHLVVQLSSTVNGWLFTVFSCSCLFVGVQLMFEYREEERRRGIDRRC